MPRKVSAWIALLALVAALVPGGLAPFSNRGQGNSCCNAGRCPMGGSQDAMAADMSMHCHAGRAGVSLGSPICTCSISPDSASIIPPTAFHFTLYVAEIINLARPAIDRTGPAVGSANPLTGYLFAMDQPPKA